MQTADHGGCARQQIENRKERPPAFVLPNVNTFVVSAPNQTIAVSAKDDMPNGDGIYMQAGQQEGGYRAFCFDDACYNDDRPAGKDDKGQQHNADAGYGEDPTVSDA